MSNSNRPDTSWEKVSDWYGSLTSTEGHYYHREVILPNVLRLLDFDNFASPSLLDLGCGQGVLARAIPPIPYLGVDLSSSLIAQAKRQNKRKDSEFIHADITKPLPTTKTFTHAAFILSLQNMEKPDLALKETSKHLASNGKCLIVLNHPCFRIPRQSSWGIDPNQKVQFRRIDNYLTPLKIPINMTPGHKQSESTWTFHFPLEAYSQFLKEADFLIESIEEWTSPKESTGKHAKMENRARKEFPLFLAINAVKK